MPGDLSGSQGRRNPQTRRRRCLCCQSTRGRFPCRPCAGGTSARLCRPSLGHLGSRDPRCAHTHDQASEWERCGHGDFEVTTAAETGGDGPVLLAVSIVVSSLRTYPRSGQSLMGYADKASICSHIEALLAGLGVCTMSLGALIFLAVGVVAVSSAVTIIVFAVEAETPALLATLVMDATAVPASAGILQTVGILAARIPKIMSVSGGDFGLATAAERSLRRRTSPFCRRDRRRGR
jgi:hypothetical protein